MTENAPKDSSIANSPAYARQQQAEAILRRSEIDRRDGGRETHVIEAQRTWSGLLPRPEDCASYNEIVPDATERLLAMVEREQAHRIKLEADLLPVNLRAGRRGQWLGAALSGLAMLLATATALYGAPWQVSVALVGVPVLGVAQSLVQAWRRSDD